MCLVLGLNLHSLHRPAEGPRSVAKGGVDPRSLWGPPSGRLTPPRLLKKGML
jgi:hypothetical protein